MKVLFLTPYPRGVAASQRFRFELFYAFLLEKNIQVKHSSFFDDSMWNVVYRPGNNHLKLWGLIKGIALRIITVLTCWKYDVIFIHREAEPVGPPVFEWLITKVFRRRMIYDYDDAIWLYNTSDFNKISGVLKRYSNAATNCRWAWKVLCGNQYLLDYARKQNPNSFYFPTVVDTHRYHNKLKTFNNRKLTLGWTGSHSTLQYLEIIKPVIAWLEKRFDFTFLVIADKKPDFDLNCMQFIRWTKEEEINDLLKIDLGLMPLPDHEWAKGKCGFKAIQYMALGIPAAVSAVGVNTAIVEHEINGYLCKNPADWEFYLAKVLENPSLLPTMSTAARQKIENEYSLKSQEEKFLNFFKE